MRTSPIRRWSFLLADEPDAWAKGFDDSGWRRVVVPHDWSVEHPFDPSCSSGTGYLPGGVGWYRGHVSLAALGLTPGRRLRLVFHGVYKNADVWVNGYHLGSRPSGHARFSFDLSEFLDYAPDDDLVVAVRVDRTEVSDSRWYNGSGLTRHVDLEVHDAVHLAEHGTVVETIKIDKTEASVRVRQLVVNDGDEDTTVTVENELRSLTSDRVHRFTSTVRIPARATRTVETVEHVLSPEPWSAEHPHLYRLTTVLRPSGEASELVVGLRTVRFDPDHGLFVNGEPQTLKGVCLHEDAGVLGTAVPAAVWMRRLLKLKAMGCNAVRMAHNPHAPALYTLCDALGFYVVDEAFDEWENPKNKWWQGHNVYPPRHEGPAKHFPVWHAADLTAMVQAHRHHPSVVAWSIGNEVDYPNDPYASPLFAEMTGNNDASKPAAERVYDPARPDIRRLTTIANRLIDLVKAADPTRPVTLAAAFPELSSLTGLLDRLDLIGYNYKEHLYESGHARFPDQPFVGSENSHSYQAWRHVVEKDYVAGQFLWTGIDYLGEAHGWPVHGSPAGLLTTAGFAKAAYHLRRSWWSAQPMAYLVTRPHTADPDKQLWTHPVTRTWDHEPGRPVEVICFSNTDELTLTCGDEQIPLTFDDTAGWWSAVVPYRAVPLTVTGRTGDTVVRDELAPRGVAVRLDARVWTPPPGVAELCAAAGITTDEVIQVEVALRDEHGAVAADDRLVCVEVAGGDLLGLDNGDLGDPTPYPEPSRRTRDARAVLYLRGGPATVVTLSAPGVADVRLDLAPNVTAPFPIVSTRH
ncbi:glycoside hydrolase family 2 TIM barrel-domain containing protein [Actinoplanes sp. NPDC026670]|uniref:glycoside hydrolase family 2 TIM barrel-domain containing protein n=1 Tax=Actinoplanes sp. NPDC026670 TaxID=3154700 RepID=UPI003403AB79